MVELHPPSERWSINARTFIKDPCTVPKVFDVKLTMPADYEDPLFHRRHTRQTESASTPIVVDHDPILHEFKTWVGHVDGTCL